MLTIRPFQPIGATADLTIGASATSVAIPTVPRGTSSVRIVVDGTSICYFGFGRTAAEAEAAATVASGLPMLGGTIETFQIRSDTLYIAVIGTDGTAYVTSGESA